jgi:hypothetical protein
MSSKKEWIDAWKPYSYRHYNRLIKENKIELIEHRKQWESNIKEILSQNPMRLREKDSIIKLIWHCFVWYSQNQCIKEIERLIKKMVILPVDWWYKYIIHK